MTGARSILWLAKEQEKHPRMWRDLEDSCYRIGSDDNTKVVITKYSRRPRIHPPSHQRVRRIWAILTHQRAGTAQVTFNVGTNWRLVDASGLLIFTGYDEPGWPDFFRITTAKGRVFEDELLRVGRKHPDFPAWWVVSPVKIRVYDNYVARLVEKLPVVDRG